MKKLKINGVVPGFEASAASDGAAVAKVTTTRTMAQLAAPAPAFENEAG